MTEQLTDYAVKVLQKALDRAEANPERFDMQNYFAADDEHQQEGCRVDGDVCGTSACLAGNIVLNNPTYTVRFKYGSFQPVNLDTLTPVDWADEAFRLLEIDPRGDNYEENGTRTLRGRVYRLFQQTSYTLDQVWTEAQKIADGRLTLPDRLLNGAENDPVGTIREYLEPSFNRFPTRYVKARPDTWVSLSPYGAPETLVNGHPDSSMGLTHVVGNALEDREDR